MADRYVENPAAGREIVALISDVIDQVLPAIATDAKRYAPVLSGYLRNHIGHEKIGPAGGIVYADAPYAAAQEEGFVHAHSGKHVPAQPYLRPALYKHRLEIS
jgi:hypothetical protein